MRTLNLTDLQLAAMKVLWRDGEASVAQVVAGMAADGRELAPTTVATLLQRLGKQGWVSHRKVGQKQLYRAKVAQKAAGKGVLQRVLHTFFGGNVSELTAQLLESERIKPDELKALQALIEKKKG